MCGVTGFIDLKLNRNKTALNHIIQDMTNTLTHRGPDSDGVWIDEESNVAFGHRRLAIIDLSAEGHQPMASPCGRYVISYNGEIYNFKELQAQLKSQDCKFKGHSDTEVLLVAISKWGLEKALQKSNGMFAFALWDKKEKTLHLARDRMGEKPLYYGWAKNSFIFASELKAFHKHPDFTPQIDRNVLALYCRHNYVPAPWSIFKDVYKLEPASFLSFSLQSKEKPEQKKYWDIKQIAEEGAQNPIKLSFEDATQQLDKILTEAVGQRMVSDVPLGAFLSGGIDSSIVVALMQKQSTQPIKTFSIGFEELEFNEAEYAKKVAKHLGTDHTEFYVTSSEARETIPSLPEMYDEPFADSSQIPTYHVSRLAKQHVTVTLSGDGGDEGFTGYSRYMLCNKRVRNIFWLPYELRNMAGSLIGAIPENIFPKGTSLSQTLKMKDSDALYRKMISYWMRPEDLVLRARESMAALTNPELHPSIENFTDRMTYWDMVSYLPDDILTKIDRASMAVSLETRTPLLDYNVIEFARTLPPSMKISGNNGKLILKELLSNYVPRHLFERPKQGFGIPLAEWLRKPLREWAEDLLNETRLKNEGFFNPLLVQKLWKQHLDGQDKSYHLWGILMFQSWHKKWM